MKMRKEEKLVMLVVVEEIGAKGELVVMVVGEKKGKKI